MCGHYELIVTQKHLSIFWPNTFNYNLEVLPILIAKYPTSNLEVLPIL